jgi:DNA mismatch repair protein MutL
MTRIRILTEQVANRIAAGEVVERPASVVKELVENALDAGATSVRVEAESGGRRLIRVVDDGCGMGHDDALLAFERHATSKLRDAEDLAAISTLGFRGEALPSIAAVSRLVLETCEKRDAGSPTAERESAASGPLRAPGAEGTRVEFAGGRLVGVKPAGLPPGTSVAVADLFYNVPARKKFLKSDSVELGHIASVVTHYALAHCDRAFYLKTPSQEIVSCAGVASLAERVYQLFGRAALDELIELPPASGPIRAAITEPALEPGEESATLAVSGFISRPEVQRPNRNATYVFVNRRLVRDRLVLHAVGEAYRNIIPHGAFPVVLLFLELPPEEVDVNVHPAKIEVRFRHANFMHDFTRDAIRQALQKARPVAAFPTGMRGEEKATAPLAQSGAAEPMLPPRAVIPGLRMGASSDAMLDGGFALTPGAPRPEPQRFAFEAGIAVAPAVERAAVAGIAERASSEPGTAIAPPGAAESDAVCVVEKSRAGGQAFAEAAPMAPASATSIATLKPLGQVSSSFIVAVNGEGLWIVDQHVAHERILFERHLRARKEGWLTGQRLLMPIVVQLAPRQVAIFERIAGELAANGFELETMGPREVAIQAAPAGIAGDDAEKLLRQILEGLERSNEAISMESLQAKIAASTACQAAIKVNMALDQTKMEWLLAELAKTDCPMSCPHGRPVLLRYSLREIEKAFKRA